MDVSRRRRFAIAVAMLACTVTTGCAREPASNMATEVNVQQEVPAENYVEPVPAPTPPPVEPPAAETVDIPPEQPRSESEQMRDDADAAGMTARLSQSPDAPSDESNRGDPAPR